MTRAIKPLPVPPVDQPATFTIADAGAIQALQRGEAQPHQQKRAIDWIIRNAASVGGQSFRTNDPYGMAFHEGRRFVAAQIMALSILDLNDLKEG